MIIFFSGTGNSRMVARLLANLTADSIIEATGELLISPQNFRGLAVDDNNHVIWVFPTYSWGVPPAFANIIKNITIEGADSSTHFMVTTCGDDIGRCNRQWRKLIEARGWSAAGAWSVQMPNTYVCMKGFDVDSPEVVQRKLQAMPAAVTEIARLITQGSHAVDVVSGSWATFKTSVIYPWFCRYEMSPKGFSVQSATCTRCGKCIRSCPENNISANRNGYPEWSSRCAFCLRCYHICPVHAIDYRGKTAGKGQYIAPEGV